MFQTALKTIAVALTLIAASSLPAFALAPAPAPVVAEDDSAGDERKEVERSVGDDTELPRGLENPENWPNVIIGVVQVTKNNAMWFEAETLGGDRYRISEIHVNANGSGDGTVQIGGDCLYVSWY